MDEAEEDDGVIFQGSPLYDSLTAGGYRLCDGDTEQLHRLSQDKQIQEDTVHDVAKTKKSPVAVLQLWLEFFCSLLCLSAKEEVGQLDQRYDRVLAHSLCSSKVLDEEDAEFLENFADLPTVTEDLPIQKRNMKFRLLLVFVVPCLVAYGYLRLYESQLPWKWVVMTDSSAILTILYLVMKGIHCMTVQIHTQRLENKREAIMRTVKLDEMLLTYMKKSLRLIQETELVARGFTLVSQKSPVSRLEQGTSVQRSSRQCPDLRKLLFYTARDAVLGYREITRKLIHLQPLGPVLDSSTSYLAWESLEQYGPCLQVAGSGEEVDRELFVLTDGFSVAALKGISHLYSLQQSEFVRRLALVFSTKIKENDSFKIQPEFDTGLESLLTDASGRLQTWSSTLQTMYDFHSCSLLERGPSPQKLRQQTSSPYSELHVAVHSLDLHLQAALTRVRSLSSWIEKVMEEYQPDDQNILSCDTLDNFLRPIRAELESCKGCWEEGVSRIDRLQKRKIKDEGTSIQKQESSQPMEPALHVIEDRDPVILDQVFETYTDPDDIDYDHYGWEKPLTAEEKEKKKREKEEALRLLTELKSVISVRAVEREKREEAALKRSNQNAPNTTTTNQSAGNKSCDIIENVDKVENSLLIASSELENGCKSHNVDLSVDEELMLAGDCGSTACDYSGDERHSDTEEPDYGTGAGDAVLKSCGNTDPDGTNRVLGPDKPDDSDSDSDSDSCGRGGFRVSLPTVSMEERLGRLQGANLPFTANLAAMAVARSQAFGGLQEATFGDGDDDEEEEENKLVHCKDSE